MNSEQNLEEESEIFLETDWIQEFEKIVDEHIYYPSESMSFLPVYCLFIEKNSIIRVCKKRIPFDLRGGSGGAEGGSRNILKYLQEISEEPYWIEWMKEYTEFVGCEDALEIENRRLEKRAKQFSLSDVLLFNVDFHGGEEVQGSPVVGEGVIDMYDDDDSHSQKYREFFRGYSVEEWKRLDSLEWKDSVFLFHSINSVFFLFRDVSVISIEVQDLTGGSASGGGGGGGGNGNILLEMPVTSILVSCAGSGGLEARGGGSRGTRKVHFGVGDFGDLEDDMMESDLESDLESESETELDLSSKTSPETWGKGKWLQKRKKNRRKTEKRKHVFTPALIRSLFV